MSSTCLLEIENLERPNAPFVCGSAPTTEIERRLTAARGELVGNIKRELDDRVAQLLVCPTAQIFVQERAKVFGEYSLLLKTVSKIILTDTDPMVHQSLIQCGIANYQARVRERGDEMFGVDVTQEILFCLATLRRAYRLVGQILAKMEVAEESADEDARNAKEFAAAASWCGIHLDCIFFSLENRESLSLDVLQEILKGCRFAVSAYAHARIGYNLRYPTAPATAENQWDDEDRYLAAVSTLDAVAVSD